jgi:hypothetical protein
MKIVRIFQTSVISLNVQTTSVLHIDGARVQTLQTVYFVPAGCTLGQAAEHLGQKMASVTELQP